MNAWQVILGALTVFLVVFGLLIAGFNAIGKAFTAIGEALSKSRIANYRPKGHPKHGISIHHPELWCGRLVYLIASLFVTYELSVNWGAWKAYWYLKKNFTTGQADMVILGSFVLGVVTFIPAMIQWFVISLRPPPTTTPVKPELWEPLVKARLEREKARKIQEGTWKPPPPVKSPDGDPPAPQGEEEPVGEDAVRHGAGSWIEGTSRNVIDRPDGGGMIVTKRYGVPSPEGAHVLSPRVPAAPKGLRLCYMCSWATDMAPEAWHKPPGTSHCSTCERCVVGYDHHCWWLGNCVAASNHIGFLRFLILAAIYCTLGAGIMIVAIGARLADWQRSPEYKSMPVPRGHFDTDYRMLAWLWASTGPLVATIIFVFGSLFTCCMSALHARMAYTGETSKDIFTTTSGARAASVAAATNAVNQVTSAEPPAPAPTPETLDTNLVEGLDGVKSPWSVAPVTFAKKEE